jgi:chemotaxis protein CheD
MDLFIKIAEAVTCGKNDVMKTVVGSCISLCIWDKETNRGGMAHIMLPEHDPRKSEAPGKYADTAVQHLITLLRREGSDPSQLVAKIAGGASMFGDTLLNIGERNTEVVRSKLSEQDIPIVFEDVGGSSGRNITFRCENGEITVKNHRGTVKKG